jgi:hypothetical protein
MRSICYICDMKTAYFRFILFLAIILSVSSCKTELEPNAQWKEIAVIYGILDINEPYQVIKISKAFLNEKTNALDLAKISDSVYFKTEDIDVNIFEFNTKGEQFAIHKLTAFEKGNREDGVFPSPNQQLYKTDTFKLNENHTYKIELKNNRTGYVASASTKIVSDFCLILPLPVPNPDIPSINGCNNITNELQGISPESKVGIQWNTTKRDGTNSTNNAISYKLTLDFYYDEIDGTSIKSQVKSMVLSDNLKIPKLTKGTYDIEKDVFTDFLKANIDVSNDPPNLVRKAKKVDLIIWAAAEELDTYISVSNAAFTAVTQVQPVYTNITNGVGIFSSRFKKVSHSSLNLSTLIFLESNLPQLKFTSK